MFVAHDSEPQTLDPALVTGVAEARITSALFEGLTRLDPLSLAPRPAAAESWEIAEDGLAWSFRLRADGRWSDGTPLTADDFRRSWLRVLSPHTASPYASLLFDVEGARAYQRGEAGEDAVGIRAPDARTLTVRLTHPVPFLPALAAWSTLLPVPGWIVLEHGDRWTRPANIVTNGPFLLEDWAFYRHITLRRNPAWHGADSVGVERIRLYPVPDPATQFNLYETGAVDLAFSVPSPILDRLRGRADFLTGPRLATAFLRLNVTHPALGSPLVRRAISLAVDRDTLVDRILRGGERPAFTLVPPGLEGYETPAAGRFDPASGAALLAEAGYPEAKGIPALTLLFPENPEYAAVATVLQHDLRMRLGLDVRLDPREWKVCLAAQRALDYDLALGQWIGDYPDPSTFLSCFAADSGNNRTGFRNREYDELLRLADAPRPAETGNDYARRRLRVFAEAERLLLAEAPLIPLWHPATRYLVSPRVRGFRPNPMGLVSFADLTTRRR